MDARLEAATQTYDAGTALRRALADLKHHTDNVERFLERGGLPESVNDGLSTTMAAARADSAVNLLDHLRRTPAEVLTEEELPALAGATTYGQALTAIAAEG